MVKPVILAVGRATGFSAAYVVSLALVMALLVAPMLLFVDAGRGDRNSGSAMASAVLVSLAALVVTWWFATLENHGLPEYGLYVSTASAREWAAGLALGFLATSLLFAIPLVFGAAEIRTHDSGGISLLSLMLWLVFFGVQSLGEELIFRGYFLRLWSGQLNTYAGLAVSSALFSAGHATNVGFNLLASFNTFMSGVLLGLVFYRTRSLWLVAGMHAGWNYGFPILGMDVSGHSVRIASVETSFTNNPLWSGGAYGPEASLVCTVVLFGTAGLLLLLWRHLRHLGVLSGAVALTNTR